MYAGLRIDCGTTIGQLSVRLSRRNTDGDVARRESIVELCAERTMIKIKYEL